MSEKLRRAAIAYWKIEKDGQIWLPCPGDLCKGALFNPAVDKGWDADHITAVECAKACEQAGAALVAVLALATGTAVAQTGLIAFVGLAAPHLVRSIVKVPHAKLAILSSLMGGALLMAADLLARWMIAPQELPVGVLTAVLGGGYLLWLMQRSGAKL